MCQYANNKYLPIWYWYLALANCEPTSDLSSSLSLKYDIVKSVLKYITPKGNFGRDAEEIVLNECDRKRRWSQTQTSHEVRDKFDCCTHTHKTKSNYHNHWREKWGYKIFHSASCHFWWNSNLHFWSKIHQQVSLLTCLRQMCIWTVQCLPLIHYSYSLFNLTKPRSSLTINGKRGFLRVNRL